MSRGRIQVSTAVQVVSAVLGEATVLERSSVEVDPKYPTATRVTVVLWCPTPVGDAERKLIADVLDLAT